jgi:hypothetical protein
MEGGKGSSIPATLPATRPRDREAVSGIEGDMHSI